MKHEIIMQDMLEYMLSPSAIFSIIVKGFSFLVLMALGCHQDSRIISQRSVYA